MNLLYYLAEANIYLGVFYLAYCLLLYKETYYQLTRAYLLFSCAAAFILPVLQVGVLKPVEVAVTSTINYTIPAYTDSLPVTDYVNTSPVVVEHHLTMQDYLVYVYLLGAVILFLMLMAKLFALIRLMQNAQTIDELNYKLVYLPQTGVAFSFFNYLFIGDNAPGANTIIRHELVHIRQKHSADIIFLELLKVINWFNPFVYLLQNSLKTVHEYIADEQTAAFEADALTYDTFLVNNAYGTDGPSFTHSFFNYNLLKKRIIMLNRERSGRVARLKYLVILPVFAGLLCTSTLAFSKTYGWVDLDPAKPAKQENSKIIHASQDFGTVKVPSVLGAQAKNGVRVFSGHSAVVKKLYAQIQVTNTVAKHDLQTPERYIADNVKYPLEDKKQSVVGRVITVFAVDANHNLQYAKVARSPSDAMSDEIIRVLKGCTEFSALKPETQYTLAITFSLGYLDGKNGESIPESQNVTKAHDPNSGIYNPNNLNISLDAPSLALGEIAIRGYLKRLSPQVVTDTVAKPDWQKFGRYFGAHVLYPSADRKEHVCGRVITIFAVDADHKLQYAKVVRTPSDEMANEVIRVLKKCTELYMLKPGIQYTLPISYILDDETVTLATQKTSSKVHDPNSGIYNPNSIDIQNLDGGLSLNETVIRGYTKQN